MIRLELPQAAVKECIEGIKKRDAELTDEELVGAAKLQVQEAYDDDQMDKIILHWWRNCVKEEFARDTSWDNFYFRTQFFDEVKTPWQGAHGPDC